MKMTVTFTEKEKEILKELNDTYDKILTDRTIFNCDCCSDCEDCPCFDKNHGCIIDNLHKTLKLFQKYKEGK